MKPSNITKLNGHCSLYIDGKSFLFVGHLLLVALETKQRSDEWELASTVSSELVSSETLSRILDIVRCAGI